MKVLFGFAVGYLVGSRSGRAGYERVERAVRDVARSDEYQRLVEALKDLASEATARLAGSSGEH